MNTKRFDHFIVRNLMEDVPPLETIDAKDPVRERLVKMCTKNYSQRARYTERFWKIVEKICPNYREEQEMLQKYKEALC